MESATTASNNGYDASSASADDYDATSPALDREHAAVRTMDELTASWFGESSDDGDNGNNSHHNASEEEVSNEDFYDTDQDAATAHFSRAQTAAAITAACFAELRDNDGDGKLHSTKIGNEIWQPTKIGNEIFGGSRQAPTD